MKKLDIINHVEQTWPELTKNKHVWYYNKNKHNIGTKTDQRYTYIEYKYKNIAIIKMGTLYGFGIDNKHHAFHRRLYLVSCVGVTTYNICSVNHLNYYIDKKIKSIDRIFHDFGPVIQYC